MLTEIVSYQTRLDRFIDLSFPATPHNMLITAMRYALQAGGKRLRPLS